MLYKHEMLSNRIGKPCLYLMFFCSTYCSHTTACLKTYQRPFQQFVIPPNIYSRKTNMNGPDIDVDLDLEICYEVFTQKKNTAGG